MDGLDRWTAGRLDGWTDLLFSLKNNGYNPNFQRSNTTTQRRPPPAPLTSEAAAFVGQQLQERANVAMQAAEGVAVVVVLALGSIGDALPLLTLCNAMAADMEEEVARVEPQGARASQDACVHTACEESIVLPARRRPLLRFHVVGAYAASPASWLPRCWSRQ